MSTPKPQNPKTPCGSLLCGAKNNLICSHQKKMQRLLLTRRVMPHMMTPQQNLVQMQAFNKGSAARRKRNERLNKSTGNFKKKDRPEPQRFDRTTPDIEK